MAAGNIRWYALFKDILDSDILVNIHDTEYSGDGTEVDIATDPLLISWLASGDDKYTNIKASEAQVTMMSTTSLQFLDVFAFGNTRFILSVYKDSVLYWRGYASPDGYNEPFRFPPYPTTMTFVDGFALLKNIQFAPPGFTEGDWNQSLIWYIKAALNEINHQLPIYAAIDLDFTSSGAGTVTSRILENIYIDWRSLRYEDGTFWTWFEVLDNILKMLQARIYLNGGAWIVENVDQKKDTYRVEKYLYTGIYDSTVAAQDDTCAMTGITPPVLRFIATGNLEVSPGSRSIKISQDYGHRTNILKFNNFSGNFFADEFDAGGAARYWDVENEATYEHKSEEDALLIHSVDEGVFPPPLNSWVITEGVDLADIEPVFYQTMINDWFEGKLSLKIKYKLKLNISGDLTLLTNVIANNTFIFRCGATNYHVEYSPFTSSDPWEWGTTGDEDIVTYFTYENISEWVDVDLTLSPPAAESGITHTSYEFYLLFKIPSISSPDPDIGFAEGDGYLIKGVQIYFEKMTERYVEKQKFANTKKFSGTFRGKTETTEATKRQDLITEEDPNYQREEELVINSENMTSPDEYLVTFGDTPNYRGTLITGGQVALNRHVLKDSSGFPVNYFSTHGDGLTQSLLFFINRANFVNTYEESQIKLRGVLIDQTGDLSFRSVLEDFDDRKYIPISMTENVKYRTFDSEWFCIHPKNKLGEFSDEFSDEFNV